MQDSPSVKEENDPKGLSEPKLLTNRVRKLSTILLLSIFAFSQYARQLSYLECKFSNTFKTNSVKCDCEKQAGLDKNDDNQSPVSKIHTHIHPDEFFSVTKETGLNSYFRILKPGANILPGDDVCEGNGPKPWQPPNT